MNKQSDFQKYKQETLELANKKTAFLVVGLILLGVSVAFYIVGFVTLAAAYEGKFNYFTADVFLIVAVTVMIGGIVMLILRKAIFDKKLKEREAQIKKIIQHRQKNKVHHEMKED